MQSTAASKLDLKTFPNFVLAAIFHPIVQAAYKWFTDQMIHVTLVGLLLSFAAIVALHASSRSSRTV